HCQLAMRIASELFSIRYVCGFGSNLPDGVVPFDELLTAETRDPLPPLDRERLNNAAAHVGLITFEVGSNGIVPVARNHLEMIAGGIVWRHKPRAAPLAAQRRYAVPAPSL